ncbi:MAG: gamma-glutamyltransferase [Bacteroidetes bacterium]|nr:gamma-glutamyltransferase [Bacteroidota bacterium]MBS1756907.1 gamma-glutamyltransferase [Bacteroidota bacterium]
MHKKYISAIVVLIFSFLHAHSQISPYQYWQQKKTETKKAAVVSAHPLASQAGLLMIQQGGNAIDAAIATQLALAVVYPGAGNIGGGGFMVAHLKNGKNISIDYRETAPAKAFKDMYLDSAGNAVAELSQTGRLACGVPGTVAGLFASLKYAKLPFKKLIAPAIALAEKGFAITESQAQSFNHAKKEFEQVNKNAVAFVKQRKWVAGDTLLQPELAATLKRIRDFGAKGFYEGKTADLIVKEMKRGNGIISREDLKNYKAKEREVLQFKYKDVAVISMPLPSSGGIIIEQLMKMTGDRNIAGMGFETAASVQLMVEAERRAYADRANFLGDPDFIKVPVEKMLNDDYLRQRMSDFTPGKAGSSDITKAGLIHESEQTTHISIVDGEGNAVSVTTTLNGGYGSKTVVSGAGFILNNEMDDFSAKPGVPNMYGAVGNAANAIAPNKRMLSSMAPTIVLKNNKPYIVVGSPGGTTIPTSVYQTLMDILEFSLSPEEAVNKPKFHHQWLPDVVDVEKDFPQNVAEQLKAMGYKINVRGAIGRTELIVISPKGKRLVTAIADKRGDDDARGL